MKPKKLFPQKNVRALDRQAARLLVNVPARINLVRANLAEIRGDADSAAAFASGLLQPKSVRQQPRFVGADSTSITSRVSQSTHHPATAGRTCVGVE